MLGKEICPIATLPRTYPTLIGPRSIPGLQNEVPMNTRFSKSCEQRRSTCLLLIPEIPTAVLCLKFPRLRPLVLLKSLVTG